MDTRFVLTVTKYDGPGIYDKQNRAVAPFVDDETAQEALLMILDGTQQPSRWMWREAYGTEVVF